MLIDFIQNICLGNFNSTNKEESIFKYHQGFTTNDTIKDEYNNTEICSEKLSFVYFTIVRHLPLQLLEVLE